MPAPTSRVPTPSTATHGIYGDLLNYWREICEPIQVFNMDAKIGGGYGERYNKHFVQGVYFDVWGGDMGIEGDLRVANEHSTIYSYEAILEGEYVQSASGDIMLCVHVDGFDPHGGYFISDMKKVSVWTDENVPTPHVNLGGASFAR